MDSSVASAVGVDTSGWLVACEKYTVNSSPTLSPGMSGSGSLAITASTPGQHATAPADEPSGGTHGRHAS